MLPKFSRLFSTRYRNLIVKERRKNPNFRRTAGMKNGKNKFYEIGKLKKRNKERKPNQEMKR